MIAAIELAIVARLKAVADAGGLPFTWNTLGTYPEDWDAYLLASANLKCPAAWVVFAGWQRTEIQSDGQLRVFGGSFGLMIADENLRPSEQYQRHGGTDPAMEPGSYRILAGAIASLAGQTLGLDLYTPIVPGALRPVRPSEQMAKRRLSMFACELNCDFPIVLVEDGALDAADLEVLHANWDIPALGSPIAVDRDLVTPGPQLPDDFHADATDELALGGDDESQEED